MMSAPLSFAAVCAIGAFASVAPAAAQGNGRGNAFGHAKSASVAPTSSPANAGVTTAPETGAVRSFGSWLDDASVVSPGSGVMSFTAGYWRMSGFTELDAPSFDVSVGFSKRVQAGASVPVYHAGATGGPVSRGLGDLFLSTKLQLREPGNGSRVGVALIPLVQVTSDAPAAGTGRLTWGLPVALELQRTGWRLYGSTGYFSRGSIFASTAIERALGDRFWVTGAVSQSRSLRGEEAAVTGLSKNRTDVSGGASWILSDSVAVFGSVGRTVSTRDPSATHLFGTGGVSVNFEAWR